MAPLSRKMDSSITVFRVSGGEIFTIKVGLETVNSGPETMPFGFGLCLPPPPMPVLVTYVLGVRALPFTTPVGVEYTQRSCSPPPMPVLGDLCAGRVCFLRAGCEAGHGESWSA